MNDHSVEARLLTLEIIVKALALTHHKPQDAFIKFSQIYPEVIRKLNKSGSPEQAKIAKELMAECDAFSHYFPKT
jgi:hypothetical protein